MPQTHRTRKYWTSLVEQFEQSGKSRDEFAKAHDIRPTNFYYWLYKLRREKKEPAKKKQPAKFVEIKVKPTPPVTSIRLELPGGATMIFENQPSPDYLATIIKSLTNVTTC